MAIYNYDLINFIATPTSSDVTIKIFDKNGVFKYSISPLISYYFFKNQYVVIKVDDAEDIMLDFEDSQTAMSALEKLNDAKTIITEQADSNITYYTKDELNTGQLDDRYYTQTAITNAYAPIVHTHAFTGLTGLEFTGLTNGEVLTYSDGIWTNSAFTFDTSAFTSNYYTIYDLSSSTSGAEINWLNIIATPTGITGYGISDVYTKDEVYNTGETFSMSEIESDYYDKPWIQTHYYTQIQLDGEFSKYSVTSHTHTLSSLSDVPTGITDGQYLVSSGGSWITLNAPNTTVFFTKTEVNNILLGYSLTSHTHDFSDLDNTGHTHDWSDLTDIPTTIDGYGITDAYTKSEVVVLLTGSTFNWTQITNTAHTHNDIYYTETELDAGQLDTRYYTKSEITGGTLDNRYYTQTWIQNHYYDTDDIDDNFYTTGQTLSLLTNYVTNIELNNTLTSTLSGYSLTSHTHVLSNITDVIISSPSAGDYLVYSGGTWVNSAITGIDLTNYYTKTELNDGQLDNQYISLSGSSNISGNLVPSIPGLTLGSPTNPWAELYVTGSTIYIGGVAIGINESGELVVSGQSVAFDADVSPTAHTHDTIYYRKTEISSLLGSDYYTQTWINTHYLTEEQITGTTGLLNNYYTSAQTVTYLENNYYTSGETLQVLSGYSVTSHTHEIGELSNISILNPSTGEFLIYSGSTWVNSPVTFATTANLSNYYTKTETDSGILPYIPLTGSSSITGSLIPGIGGLSLGSVSSPWKSLYLSGSTIYIDGVSVSVDDGQLVVSGQTVPLTYQVSLSSHTHDTRYYTQTLLDNGQLDSQYYTQDWINTTYFTKDQISGTTGILNNYYTSAQTNIILTNYRTSALTDILLDNKSDITHNHAISALTDTNFTSLQDGDFMVYSAGTWINTGYSFDDYYTKTELDNGQLDNRYYTISQLYNTGETYTKTEVSSIIGSHTGLTGVTNPHQIAFDDLTSTAHTHDERYYTQLELLPVIQTQGESVLDARYYTQDWINNHYYDRDDINDLILSGVSSGISLAMLNVEDDDVLVEAGVKTLNFKGVGVKSIIDANGDKKVNIWVPPPAYAPNFNETNDQGSAVISNITGTNRYMSSGLTNAFRGDWDPQTLQQTIDGMPNMEFTSSDFSIYNSTGSSYIKVEIFYYLLSNTSRNTITIQETIEWVSGQTIISGETIYGIIEVTGITEDSDRFKASAIITIKTSALITNGGRLGVKISHYNDGDNDTGNIPWEFTNADLYFDGESTNPPTISGLTMVPGTEVVKYLSGIKFYTTGQPWTFSTLGIDNINDQTWKADNFTGDVEDFSISTDIDSTSLTTDSNWSGYTNIYDLSGVNYVRSLTINVDDEFRMGNATATGNIADFTITDTDTEVVAVLIDTQTDTPTNLYEDFRGEDYRISSTGITSGGTWDSTLNLTGFTGLQVIGGLPTINSGGILLYPQHDFSAYNPSGNPDYTSSSGDRYYVRRFWAADGTDSQQGVLNFTWYNSDQSTYGFNEQDMVDGTVEIDVNFWGDQDRWCKVYTQVYPITSPIEGPASGSESESYFVDGVVCRTDFAGFGLGDHPDYNTGDNDKIKFTSGTNSINEIWVRVKIERTATNIKITSISLENDGSNSGWN